MFSLKFSSLVLCLSSLLLLSGSRASADPVLLAHGIPDLSTRATLTATQDGEAGKTATWGGKVVQPTDVLRVPTGRTVTISGALTAAAVVVEMGGKLNFAPQVASTLRTNTLLIKHDGVLETNPNTGSVRIVLDPTLSPLSPTDDPEDVTTAVIIMGQWNAVGRQTKPYVRLAQAPKAGDTALYTSEITGWQVGDTLALPDSRQPSHRFYLDRDFRSHSERATLKSIVRTSTGVYRLDLKAPLQWEHRGSSPAPGDPRVWMPHAANLSRQITITSANPTGRRGHFMVVHGQVDLTGVSFESLGRTTQDALTAPFGGNGKGRYGGPHFHHCAGPWTGDWRMRVRFCAVSDFLKWGAVMHATSKCLLEDNVFAFGQGTGIVFEDGTERGNVIRRCLMMPVRGQVTTMNNYPHMVAGFHKGDKDDWGYEGNGLAWRREANVVEDIIAADCSFAGVGVDTGGTAALFPLTLDQPAANWVAMSDAENDFWSYAHQGEADEYRLNGVEAYGCLYGLYIQGDRQVGGSNLVLWNNHTAVFGHHANRWTLENLTIRGDSRPFRDIANNWSVTKDGAYPYDYIQRNWAIRSDKIYTWRKLDMGNYEYASVTSPLGGIPNSNTYNGTRSVRKRNQRFEDVILRGKVQFAVYLDQHYVLSKGAPAQTFITRIQFVADAQGKIGGVNVSTAFGNAVKPSKPNDVYVTLQNGKQYRLYPAIAHPNAPFPVGTPIAAQRTAAGYEDGIYSGTSDALNYPAASWATGSFGAARRFSIASLAISPDTWDRTDVIAAKLPASWRGFYLSNSLAYSLTGQAWAGTPAPTSTVWNSTQFPGCGAVALSVIPADLPSTPILSNHRSSIAFDAGGFSGYVTVLGEHPATFDVYMDGKKITSFMNTLYRSDLKMRRYFNPRISWAPWQDGNTHKVDVRLRSTGASYPGFPQDRKF